MQLLHGCVVQQVLDIEKTVQISCQERSWTMPLAEILVWWKRDWHWIKTNEIGDGMQPVYVAERPFMLPKIDAAWLVRGMSLYKEFDEIKNIWSTYLYKFPKQDIYLETLQQVLSTHAPEYSVQRDRFVQLTGNVLPHMNEDEAGIALTHSGHGGPISFLCGVCAAYGQLRIDEDLTSVHATIPLVGSIAQQEGLLCHVLQMLADQGIYVRIDVQNESLGQSIQLRSTDREVITLLAHMLGKPATQVQRKQDYEEKKSHMIERLAKQTVDQALLDSIDLSVVKLLKK